MTEMRVRTIRYALIWLLLVGATASVSWAAIARAVAVLSLATAAQAPWAHEFLARAVARRPPPAGWAGPAHSRRSHGETPSHRAFTEAHRAEKIGEEMRTGLDKT